MGSGYWPLRGHGAVERGTVGSARHAGTSPNGTTGGQTSWQLRPSGPPSASVGTSPPRACTPTTRSRWERRDARIVNYRDGTVAFEQLGVEVPESWSVNATNILAQKYFRGTVGTPEREWSLKQVADRVVDTITAWGVKDGYFVDDAEAEIFRRRAEAPHHPPESGVQLPGVVQHRGQGRSTTRVRVPAVPFPCHHS